MLKNICIALTAVISVTLTQAHAAEPLPIYYNQSGGTEKSLAYNVLELALSKSGKTYKIEPAPIKYSNSAAQIDAIANGAQLDIVWASASKKASEKLLSVPFPIDGGLLGYRIFLIDKARQGEFNQVKNLQDLSKFIALQGAGWADVTTLRQAGLTVRTGPKNNLYKMTIGQRGDYFARAVHEALAEQEQQVGEVPALAVEQNLVLQYPATMLFYVSKEKTGLRDDILKGIEAAWNDGSYHTLFMADPTVQAALTKANLPNRTIIKIDNPNFPDELASMDPKYWFDPKK